MKVDDMNRREFLKGVAVSAAGAAFGGCRMFGEGESYSVSVLGDTHYDTAPDTVYHAGFRRLFDGTGGHPSRYKEFVRNAKMWAGPSRRILEASGKCVTPDTRFVLQMGDLIQGDCNDFAVHRRMLGDTLAFMRSVYPKDLPFISVCGNHDIRHGNDADDNAAIAPYEEFMVPYARGQVGTMGTVDGTTFGFRSGPDLYVMVNFNKGATTVPVVRRILAANPDVRHTFVVTHGGVFPFDSWETRWFYLGGPELDASRREMRALLASRDAIVLCGHTHKLELKDAEFPEGRITEMTMNTVQGTGTAYENPAEPEVVREGAETYGDTEWARSANIAPLFDEYRPYMKRYYLAKAVGHARMRVSDRGVWFDYYGRDALTPTRTFRLR